MCIFVLNPLFEVNRDHGDVKNGVHFLSCRRRCDDDSTAM